MILPVPRTSMCSSAAWATKKAPDKLMEMTRSQSSSPILATVLSMVIPALLTRMSRRPCCSMTSRTTRRQSSGSPMFPLWTVIVPGYSAFMSSVNFPAASCCRQYPAAMCAPSWARRWLMAAPMPRVPPVTRATRSSSRPNESGGFASVAVVMVLLLSVSLAVAAIWRTLGVQWPGGRGRRSRHDGPLVPGHALEDGGVVALDRGQRRGGVNRGISDMVQPNRTQMFRMLDRPNTWNSGSTVTTMSSGCTSNRRPRMSAFMYSWMWMSSAPVGWPVVPEV